MERDSELQTELAADLERHWAERDAKREAFEAKMAAQAEAHRQAHIAIVADALRPLPVSLLVADGWTYTKDDLARIAVDALLANGVVFARMGPCCEAHNDGGDGGANA